MKFIFNAVILYTCSLFIVQPSYALDTLDDYMNRYGINIPDISAPGKSGPVPGQQGTTITIDPSIYKLFPEVSGLPQTINLTDYKLTNLTFDDLMSEWERRDKAQQQVQMPTLPTFQTIGFPASTGFQAGMNLTGAITTQGANPLDQLFQLSAPGGAGSAPSSWSPFNVTGQGTLSTSGIYPWMSSYWTASPAQPESQTPSNPLFPLLGQAAQSLGGTGIIP